MTLIKKGIRYKIVSLLLLQVNISFPSVATKHNTQKHVIGTSQDGFFSSFLSVLNHLGWCEKIKKIPVVYWDERSLYYDNKGYNGTYNVWEYYFEPVSHLQYQEGDHIDVRYATEDWHFHYRFLEQSYRNQAYILISKYIQIKKPIQEKIDQFYQQNMTGKKTIGIHIRGTDKGVEEKLVDPEWIINKGLKYVDSSTQFLIASDEQQLIDKMIYLLRDHKVVYYECYRSKNGKSLHKTQNHHQRKKRTKRQLGEDVLVEASLLAKCDMLIHTSSNVSTAVLYFNPYIKHLLVKPRYN